RRAGIRAAGRDRLDPPVGDDVLDGLVDDRLDRVIAAKPLVERTRLRGGAVDRNRTSKNRRNGGRQYKTPGHDDPSTLIACRTTTPRGVARRPRSLRAQIRCLIWNGCRRATDFFQQPPGPLPVRPIGRKMAT